MTTFKILPATFDQLLDDGDMIRPTTTSDKGVFKRTINVAKLMTELEGWEVDGARLKRMLANCNAAAFPNQDAKSHKSWGSRKFSSLVKLGVLEPV